MIRKFKTIGTDPKNPKESIEISVKLTTPNDDLRSNGVRIAAEKQINELKDSINDVLREYYYQSQITIK